MSSNNWVICSITPNTGVIRRYNYVCRGITPVAAIHTFWIVCDQTYYNSEDELWSYVTVLTRSSNQWDWKEIQNSRSCYFMAEVTGVSLEYYFDASTGKFAA